MLAQTTHARLLALSLERCSSAALNLAPLGPMYGALAQAFLALPFDAMRFHYASAVLAGVVQRSIRASGALERAVDTLETLSLGPLARQR